MATSPTVDAFQLRLAMGMTQRLGGNRSAANAKFKLYHQCVGTHTSIFISAASSPMFLYAFISPRPL